MADNGRPDSAAGEPDSKGSLWRAIRKVFAGDEDHSLRAQIEEAIEEHEEDGDADTGNGDLSPIERQMVRNLLHFSEKDADDVAIPRSAIIAISAAATWDEVVSAFAVHGHSRLPVYRDTLDEVIGMMLMKDVFPILASGKAPPRDWTTLMRQPLFVPQARSALDVLADMRSRRIHLAVVVDEYSGTDGITTFEDLVEEIVGEVEDEHDDAPVEAVRLLEDGSWDADAKAELDDVAEKLDPRLAEAAESVDTLGGLAFLLAEQVPAVGAVLLHPSGWRVEVTAGDERHVTRLRLHPPRDTDD
ncbi:MAG: hemolysin family protein [Sphingomonadales bacterium]|nr:hemolysin family protein [Sphingomonadales bacterium]